MTKVRNARSCPKSKLSVYSLRRRGGAGHRVGIQNLPAGGPPSPITDHCLSVCYVTRTHANTCLRPCARVCTRCCSLLTTLLLRRRSCALSAASVLQRVQRPSFSDRPSAREMQQCNEKHQVEEIRGDPRPMSDRCSAPSLLHCCNSLQPLLATPLPIVSGWMSFWTG